MLKFAFFVNNKPQTLTTCKTIFLTAVISVAKSRCLILQLRITGMS